MYKVTTDNHEDTVKNFIVELQNWVEREDLYGGLTNQDILEYHYDEEVYQFGQSPLSSYDVKTLITYKNNHYQVTLQFRNGKTFNIGTITDDGQLNEHLSKSNCEPRIFILGGRYKRVVVDKEGSDHIKSFRKPYEFQIKFMEMSIPTDVTYTGDITSQEMLEHDKWTNISQKAESFGNTMEDVGNGIAGCGCILFCIIGLIIFIPLLIVIISNI